MPTAHDEVLRPLVLARALTLGRLTPRRHRMTAAGGLAFTTAERMVDRVHRYAAVVRTPAEPAQAARLAVVDVLIVGVGHRADGRQAFSAHQPHLARGQAQLSITGVL